jgi:hypothetical protein
MMDLRSLQSAPARWAVGLALAAAAVFTLSHAIFGMTWLIAGEDAVSDTAVGYLAGFSLLGGLVVSAIAFLLALVARAKQPQPGLLWFPIAWFPSLVLVVVLVEVLWFE